MTKKAKSLDDALTMLAMGRIEEFNAWREESDEIVAISCNYFESLRSFDISGCNLSNALCRGLVLSVPTKQHPFLTTARKVDFRDADLRDAKCQGVDFSESDFTGAKLDGADLEDCNLSGCNIRAEQLASCQIRGAKLTSLSFNPYAKINFDGKDLRGVDFYGTSFATEARFRKADLRGAHFFGCQFFEKGSFEGARFSGNIEDLGMSLEMMNYHNLVEKAVLPVSWLTILLEYRKILLQLSEK